MNRRLSPAQHLAWIRENVDTVLAIPADYLDAQVVDCPGWQLDSIANHFLLETMLYEAIARLPAERNTAEASASVPWTDTSYGQAAVELCRHRFDELLAFLEGLDPLAPCAFFTGPADVATLLWHIAGETWVHRADVEHTLGVTPDLGPDAGLDALDWSRLIRVWFSELNDGEPPPAILCQAIESDGGVVVGSGPVAATVSGKGCDLALRLWNRQHGPLQGDGVAVQAWADLVYRSS